MTVGARELRDGVAVPIETEPFQAIEDRGDGRLVVALAIRILDAQKELAVAAPGVEPIEQRRAAAADMQVSGGRGSKSDDGRGRWSRSQSLDLLFNCH